jgi:hypothetical protein
LKSKTPKNWNTASGNMTALTACVIAQQYSSATFVSLHFYFHKEKFGAHGKLPLFNFLLV